MLTITFRFGILPDPIWKESMWEGEIEQRPSRFIKGANLFERIEEVGKSIKSVHLAGPMREVSTITMELCSPSPSKRFSWHKIFPDHARGEIKILKLNFSLLITLDSRWEEQLEDMGGERKQVSIKGDDLAKRVRALATYEQMYVQTIVVEQDRIVLGLSHLDNKNGPNRIWYWRRIR